MGGGPQDSDSAETEKYTPVGDPGGVCFSILVMLPLSASLGKESQRLYSNWLKTKNSVKGQNEVVRGEGELEGDM